jgi:hypothetical protein
MAADTRIYIIPKQDGRLQNREDYAKKIVGDLCGSAPIETNAAVVKGINIINAEYKFVRLLDEAYKSFLIGLYHSTIALSSLASERLCYDILEKSVIKINEKVVNNEQKKAFFRIPYATLIELLLSIGLITKQTFKDMSKINNLRNKYIHPVLEGDPYDDAKRSLNLLCTIIDSLPDMADRVNSKAN